MTGSADPGKIYVCIADQVEAALCGSPHYLGLFEVLKVARCLRLTVPEQTAIIAVEAAECTTVGDAMHPDLLSAIPEVVEQAGRILGIRPARFQARYGHGLPLGTPELLD